jgi:hypothetical protein
LSKPDSFEINFTDGSASYKQSRYFRWLTRARLGNTGRCLPMLQRSLAHLLPPKLFIMRLVTLFLSKSPLLTMFKCQEWILGCAWTYSLLWRLWCRPSEPNRSSDTITHGSTTERRRPKIWSIWESIGRWRGHEVCFRLYFA